MNEEEAKKLIKTGTIKEIQMAIDSHRLDVNGTMLAHTITRTMPGQVFKLPYICYAMYVGRPDVLKVFLDNNADANIGITLDAVDNKFDTVITPLRFALGAYSSLFGKSVFPENFSFKNVDEHATEYIPLLLKHGAELSVIELADDLREAMDNPNPVVLNTFVREVKKQPVVRKILKELLKIEDKFERTVDGNFPDGLQASDALKKEYEGAKKLRDAIKARKPKRELLKMAGKGVRAKAKKATEKAALYAKKQKQND